MAKGSIENCDDSLPRIVKVSKEVLILSMLSERSMSGYDLIKKIFTETDVLLSQATVYPILYSFEEAGILKGEYEKGDMRTKKYHITPTAGEIARSEIENFVEALYYVVNLIAKQDAPPKRDTDMSGAPASTLRLNSNGPHRDDGVRTGAATVEKTLL